MSRGFFIFFAVELVWHYISCRTPGVSSAAKVFCFGGNFLGVCSTPMLFFLT
jgi:hypothetical protein